MKMLIADDHTFTRDGIKNFLNGNGYHNITVCSNGIEAWNHLHSSTYDCAILDLNMPGMDGLEIAEKLKIHHPYVKVILITMEHSYTVYKKAMEYGVSGYILKECAEDELLICIKNALNNEPYYSSNITGQLVQSENGTDNTLLNTLTLQEKKIVSLIAEQKSSKQIADLLFLSVKTIETHRRNIIEKLQLPKEHNALLKWAILNARNPS